MPEQKKRPAAATVERSTTNVAPDFNVTHFARLCKKFVFQLGMIFAAFAALLFVGAIIERTMSTSAGMILLAVAGWLCVAMYRCSEDS